MSPPKYRFPIALKMAMWLLLNLGLLALGGWLVFRAQFRAGFGSYLTNAASPRVEALASVVTRTLRSTNPAQWNAALSSLSATQGVPIAVFENNGTWVAGERFELPEAVRKELAGRGGDTNRRGAGNPRPIDRPDRPPAARLGEPPDGPPEGSFGPEPRNPGDGHALPPRFGPPSDRNEIRLRPNEEKIWPKFLVATSGPTPIGSASALLSGSGEWFRSPSSSAVIR